MTIQRKATLLLIPFQAYCVFALLGLLLCRLAYGHEARTSLTMFLAWSSMASSFLWLIGSAVQAHFGLTKQACVNAALAIASIFAVAHFIPYLAT
jgi:hypothetical protein